MMNIDEAIKHEEIIADACKEQANMQGLNDPYARKVAYENGKCADEHKQIVEWLKELKRLKEKEPCEDCVSRVDLINKLEIVDKMYGSDFYWEMRKIVDSLLPVKPVQKKGKWITKYHGFPPEPTTVCSECGFDRDFNIHTRGFGKMKYCPRCGTKMVSDE